MPENELFAGLEGIVFDQPDFIDTGDFNKQDKKEPEGKSDDTAIKAEDKSKDKSDSKENLIDVNDFFNRVEKDKAEPKSEESDDTEDTVEDKVEDKPEDVLVQWSNYFKENMLLHEEDLEGFDGSMDALVTAFQKRENRVGLEMVNDYKSQLPHELKVLADNWEEGVPLNELIDIRSNRIKYSQITEEKLKDSVETQKATHKDYLKRTTRFSDSKIDKEIQRLIDLDELTDESIDSLKELKILDDQAEETLKRETKKQKEIRLEENAKQIKAYEKYVSSTKEVIPGLKLSQKDQIEVFDKIVNPIGIDGYGNPVSYITNIRNLDPFKFDTAVTHLAMITTDKEGKPFSDWSKIIKTGETKATKALENVLNTAPPKNTKDNIKTDKKESLMDLLSKNKVIFGR